MIRRADGKCLGRELIGAYGEQGGEHLRQSCSSGYLGCTQALLRVNSQ